MPTFDEDFPRDQVEGGSGNTDMRHEPEYFGDRELVLVYAAKRLKEALALEEVLDAGALDYTVVPGAYIGGFLFRSQRIGAFFYAAPECVELARSLMQTHGFTPIEPS